MLGGLLYKNFSEKNDTSLSVSKWIIYRMVSFLSALFATLTLITFFTRTTMSHKIILERSLQFSLDSYVSLYFLIASLCFLIFSKGLKIQLIHVQQNGLGRKV